MAARLEQIVPGDGGTRSDTHNAGLGIGIQVPDEQQEQQEQDKQQEQQEPAHPRHASHAEAAGSAPLQQHKQQQHNRRHSDPELRPLHLQAAGSLSAASTSSTSSTSSTGSHDGDGDADATGPRSNVSTNGSIAAPAAALQPRLLHSATAAALGDDSDPLSRVQSRSELLLSQADLPPISGSLLSVLDDADIAHGRSLRPAAATTTTNPQSQPLPLSSSSSLPPSSSSASTRRSALGRNDSFRPSSQGLSAASPTAQHQPLAAAPMHLSRSHPPPLQYTPIARKPSVPSLSSSAASSSQSSASKPFADLPQSTSEPTPAPAPPAAPAPTPAPALPSSSTTATLQPSAAQPGPISRAIDSLWDYVKGELTSGDFDESQDLKTERIRNFLNVPLEIERLMYFGYLICLDSFLYIFTILPLRILIAIWCIIKWPFGGSPLKPAQKTDIVKGVLVCICTLFLQFFDASRLYHSVRGQALIKLYVIFNVLEICDKLCSAFGHDILDSLFSTSYPSRHAGPGLRRISRITHFVVATIYITGHSLILFYQVMTLNVAINSYNNALMTLLLSNQFVEIKSSVFKRFEKENLFQLSCSDIVERFQLSVFLAIISIRNCLELVGGNDDGWAMVTNYVHALSHRVPSLSSLLLIAQGVGPWLMNLMRTQPRDILPTLMDAAALLSSLLQAALKSDEFKLIQMVLIPVLAVYATEVLVDWLKHAFITKFNNISAAVYARYVDSLILARFRPTTAIRSTTWSPIVARRIGFVSIPLACLVIRVSIQTLQMIGILRLGGDSASETVVLMDANDPDDLGGWRIPISVPSWMNVTGFEFLVEQSTVELATWAGWAFLVYACLVVFKLALGMRLLHMARSRLDRVQAESALAAAAVPPSTNAVPATAAQDSAASRAQKVPAGTDAVAVPALDSTAATAASVDAARASTLDRRSAATRLASQAVDASYIATPETSPMRPLPPGTTTTAAVETKTPDRASAFRSGIPLAGPDSTPNLVHPAVERVGLIPIAPAASCPAIMTDAPPDKPSAPDKQQQQQQQQIPIVPFSPNMNEEKLDSIDRFTMVKSRIV
ncbi:eukaryotic membrane protein family-domain-containing protein [Entophlyctis helioformis]|nr:eukaryotic membrane protein family-domain-containing protein [Entophlyctis helioformis]